MKKIAVIFLIAFALCLSLSSCEAVEGLIDEVFGHTVPPSEPPACEHTESDWVIKREATCKIAGERYTACTKCKAVIRSEGYLAPHNFLYGQCTECGEWCPSEGLEYTYDDWGDFYILTGMGTCTDTDIVIPSTYMGKTVSSISSSAFYRNTEITSVSFMYGIHSIEGSAFLGCTSLSSVKLCNAITIGPYAFDGCTSLEVINIPKDVKIGMCAFRGCSPDLRATFDAADRWYSGPIGWQGGSALNKDMLADPEKAGKYLLSTENFIWRKL